MRNLCILWLGTFLAGPVLGDPDQKKDRKLNFTISKLHFPKFSKTSRPAS